MDLHHLLPAGFAGAPPQLPSDTQIWHSVWHRTNTARVNSWYCATLQITALLHGVDSLNELQPIAQIANTLSNRQCCLA